MKRTAIYILFFILLISCSSSQYMTGGGGYYDISDNLDLEAVAYLFGESENLRDFEQRLNDPEFGISNLDLNRDGYVDYLRVVDASERGIYLVVIQAVLGRSSFQDVATISVGRDSRGMPIVEVAGDDYLYGSNYILVPEYVRQPVIFSFFWGPSYQPWHSPYNWGYYPSYYVRRKPWPVHRYHEHINRHHYVPRSSHYTSDRKISVPDRTRRNDYGSRRPENSFINRNQGVQNKEELNRRRSETPSGRVRPSDGRRSTGEPAQVPQTAPSSGRPDSGSKQEAKPTRREPAVSPTVNPDSKPAQEQRNNRSGSGSGRRSGERTNSASDQKTNTTITKEKNTASPSVRPESTSRRQTTTSPAKETRQETKSNNSGQTKSSGSRQTKSGSGRR
ncbi:MAG: hypothetical protein AB2L24_25585 [Mangrovibacterium sp.]